MLAGWLSAFRNRAYLGWLGLAFMAVSGYLLAYDRGQTARSLGLPEGGAIMAQKAALLVCIVAFLLSLVAAARETVRRIREIRESHQAAEEALLAMIQASQDREPQTKPENLAEQDQTSPPGSPDA